MTTIGDEVRVRFDLDAEQGFPPISSEHLIGRLVSANLVYIDNTPFFVEGIALGDVVVCSGEPPNMHFARLYKEGGNKALSIIFIDRMCEEETFQYLRSQGCYCEFGEFPEFDMLAVCVPGDVPYDPIKDVLCKDQDSGKISLAELCL